MSGKGNGSFRPATQAETTQDRNDPRPKLPVTISTHVVKQVRHLRQIPESTECGRSRNGRPNRKLAL